MVRAERRTDIPGSVRGRYPYLCSHPCERKREKRLGPSCCGYFKTCLTLYAFVRKLRDETKHGDGEGDWKDPGCCVYAFYKFVPVINECHLLQWTCINRARNTSKENPFFCGSSWLQLWIGYLELILTNRGSISQEELLTAANCILSIHNCGNCCHVSSVSHADSRTTRAMLVFTLLEQEQWSTLRKRLAG